MTEQDIEDARRMADATVRIAAPSRLALLEALYEVIRQVERGVWLNESHWTSGAYHYLEVKSDRRAALIALGHAPPADH